MVSNRGSPTSTMDSVHAPVGLARDVGANTGINPDRPKVAEFGCRLWHNDEPQVGNTPPARFKPAIFAKAQRCYFHLATPTRHATREADLGPAPLCPSGISPAQRGKCCPSTWDAVDWRQFLLSAISLPTSRPLRASSRQLKRTNRCCEFKIVGERRARPRSLHLCWRS